MASNLRAMASTLVAMASTLVAVASNLLGIQVAAAESRKRLYARTSGTTATVAFFAAQPAESTRKVYSKE